MLEEEAEVCGLFEVVKKAIWAQCQTPRDYSMLRDQL